MKNFGFPKEDPSLHQLADQDDESEDVAQERRALRLAIGVLTLIVGVGVVLNAISTLLRRLVE